MEARKNNLLNFFILFFPMLVCGLISVSFGKEMTWDLAGYHFYNPYAFLHGRINVDYWPPSALQSYLSPAFDFFSYFLITHFSPMATEFILGSLHGLNFALLFFISRFFAAFFMQRASHQFYVAMTLALLGMYAPTVLPYIGSFSNDNSVSIFVLLFIFIFLLLLKNFSATGRLPIKQILLANLMLGIAAGAKLTVAPYIIGAFAAMVCLPISWPAKAKLFFFGSLGIFLGLVLSSGYWMWTLWQHFHNPFFPFLNGIFHSPYFQSVNWLEPRYMPTNIIETIFFPFYFSYLKPTGEFYFRDFRFAILYVLLALLLPTLFYKKQPPIFKSHFIIWFYLFFIFSYITWQMYFSIMRYLGVLQMLAPIFIFLLVLQLTQSFVKRMACLTAFYMFIFMTMIYSMPARVPFGSNYFDVKLPGLVQQAPLATVLIPYPAYVRGLPAPNHYLIPFFPEKWRFTGIPFHGYEYDVPKTVREFIARGPQQLFLLASSNYIPFMYHAARDLQLEPNGECKKITSERQYMTREVIMLCPVKKM